jgi:Uma2 family endonuclease
LFIGNDMATVNHSIATDPFVATTYIPRDESGNLFVPSSVQTWDGFRRWALSEECPDRGRFTFAARELIIDMSPEYLETHNFLKTEITTVIHGLAKKQNLGRVFSDRCLFSNEAAGISTEPDATFCSFSSLRSGRSRIVRGARPGVSDELVGSPEWVLEIVSPSSVRKDRKLLYDGYFRAGVIEYWLIDALGDDIDFQVLVAGVEGYAGIQPENGWLTSPTFHSSFRLTRRKDENGLWDYTLDVQQIS